MTIRINETRTYEISEQAKLLVNGLAKTLAPSIEELDYEREQLEKLLPELIAFRDEYMESYYKLGGRPEMTAAEELQLGIVYTLAPKLSAFSGIPENEIIKAAEEAAEMSPSEEKAAGIELSKRLLWGYFSRKKLRKGTVTRLVEEAIRGL